MAISMLNEQSVVISDEQQIVQIENQFERDIRLVRLAMVIVEVNNGYKPTLSPGRPQHAAFIAMMKQYLRTFPGLGRRRIQRAFDDLLHTYRSDNSVSKAKMRQLRKGLQWATGALRSAQGILEGKKTGVSTTVLIAMVDTMLIKSDETYSSLFPSQ